MHGSTGECAFPHAVGDEAGDPVAAAALELEGCSDLFPLGHHERVGPVAACLDLGENVDGLFGTTNLCEPTWRTRKEGKASQKTDSGDILKGEGCTEGARRVLCSDETAAITNKEHDQDAEFNGELLNNDDTATFVLLGDFGEIDGDLR